MNFKDYYFDANGFADLYYNATTDQILVAANKEILVFNRDLKLISRIDTSLYSPCSMREHNQVLYAAACDTSVLVIKNETVVNF